MSKNFNLIPDRIKNIQNMIKNNIEPIINFKNYSEHQEYPLNISDIRNLIPKKYIDLEIAINDLGGKLLYIKSGSTGHTFKGIHFDATNNQVDDNKTSYAVKIVAYPKKENYGDMYNINRPENTELLIIRLLSYFVLNKQTPHIVLPITTFNTNILPFVELYKSNIVNNKKFEQFIEKYDKGEYYQNVSILISEWANGGDLLDYIKKNYKTMKIKHWRTILFQILSVLAIIQEKYPSFRHNDLKANNILIHNIDIDKQNKNNKKFIYKINNSKYAVENIGIRIKIWDFDFACIPNIVNNSKVCAEWTNKINICPIQNRYYDIHYLFNTLVRKGFFPEFFTAPEIPDKVKSFVKRVVPSKYRSGKYVTERGRILVNDEYLLPDDIIKNDVFFKSLRIES